MGEEDASTSSAAELIFQLTASCWPFCVTALHSSWAGCPCAAPAEQCWSHHLWLAGAAWLEEVQGFWEQPREQSTCSPCGLELSSLCTCFSVTVDFTGVSWKEFEFGLLKPSWGSEGCSQTSEVSWG